MNDPHEFNIDGKAYAVPADRYYGREDHMWALEDKANQRVIIGMDALGIAALGDLAYVTLLPVGTEVRRGKPLGNLEAAKMTGNITSPVSGTIVARNENAIHNPQLVNQDAYQAGWLVAIQPTNWAEESAHLVSSEALPAWLDAELTRYRQQGWID